MAAAARLASFCGRSRRTMAHSLAVGFPGLRPLASGLQGRSLRGFCSLKEEQDAVDPYLAEVNEFTLELGQRLVEGDRVALSRAITLSELSV